MGRHLSSKGSTSTPMSQASLKSSGCRSRTTRSSTYSSTTSSSHSSSDTSVGCLTYELKILECKIYQHHAGQRLPLPASRLHLYLRPTPFHLSPPHLTLPHLIPAMFVSGLPIIPLVCFFANIIEIRVDGWKLLHEYRYPAPEGAQNIGKG